MQTPARELFSYRKHWAQRFGVAPFLPMSREEMDALGWDSCDVILVTGDAYVDHPSFGMAIVGRLLEAQGFRVGIVAQPDWRSPEPWRQKDLGPGEFETKVYDVMTDAIFEQLKKKAFTGFFNAPKKS